MDQRPVLLLISAFPLLILYPLTFTDLGYHLQIQLQTIAGWTQMQTVLQR